jgi:uncharacterized protein (TIGR02466 family)
MSAGGTQIISAFAVPIASSQLADAGPLNAQLRALFLEREAEGERWRKKVRTPTQQINIFESEFDLFSWPEPPVQQLRSYCLGTLSQVVMQLSDYSQQQLQMLPGVKMLVDCWFHVTRYGGYIGSHIHPMASWSGVYCVAPGEDVPDRPGSGMLCFPDFRPATNMYVDPGNVRLKRPFGSGALTFKQKAGELLLFPSYLPHLVEPYFGRDERITVAFNVSFMRPEGSSFGF